MVLDTLPGNGPATRDFCFMAAALLSISRLAHFPRSPPRLTGAPPILNSRGAMNLITGSGGSGGARTAVAMQAAGVLGLRAEDVAPTVADTDVIGYTATTGGSRTAFDTGLAAITAAEEVKRQMVSRAALIWEEIGRAHA